MPGMSNMPGGPPLPPPMPGFNTMRRLLKEKKIFDIDAKISKRLMWKKVKKFFC